MKGKTSLVLCLLSVTLASLALTASVGAAPTASFAWINPAFKGHDSYYDETITGYLTGTDWSFTLSWTHDYGNQVNISAVRIYFSWGKNYTYRFASPTPIKPHIPYVFNIQNSTPSNTEAPEYWTYEYWVYLHHVNGTTGSLSERPMLPTAVHGSNFAVLSQDHFECLNLFMKYGLPTVDGSPFVGSPNITAALVNFTQAMMEFRQGSAVYSRGMFNAAKIHLQLGDSYWVAALNSWTTRGTDMEDAALDYRKSETNYNNALANSSLVNAYGWLLFGLGWTFIGLGLIVYASRRPKTPAPS